ncbi:PEP-CTERM sorting domain-containing protein [Sphingomonas panacisoli]|uniref:PEP-CTERM sorting domain-containing protein n=1 Tax=Sphingomonas panacisoli TaxID=1813879 RepID=A0A5B8LJY2_9SPHN|nr:PEPxxWA-CTERM sorting domain-containing protein [Sphingomonas panacisoli]QDZ07852.1 PEP-CTERM sorting domain-containing protein [Sphingomonas panacisoli]
MLAGLFASSGSTGYTFADTPFSGLTGGSTDTNNLLTFNYTGLGAGIYNNTLTFSGRSQYAGLNDFALTPITITVRATVTGTGPVDPGAVPEPATWTMMILGLGLIGGSMRRRTAQRTAA